MDVNDIYGNIRKEVFKLNSDEKVQLTLDLWDVIAKVEVVVPDISPAYFEIWNEVLRLSKDEKIQLAMDTWESIPDNDKPGLTQEQKKELDRRIEMDRKGEAKYITWEEMKEKFKITKDK
jgi:putative addiction module component (TIGR02574 family)